MKIFVTSDIHGKLSAINKIVKFSNSRTDIECIFLCGDITGDYMCSSFNELEEMQYRNYLDIKQLLKSTKRDFIFILGNHDVFTVEKEDVNYLPSNKSEKFKDYVAFDYINFLMYGTKREGNEVDIRYRLSKLNIDEKSIVIAHIPPFKCLDKANNINYGSKAIKKMIKDKRPAYYICGHVHDAFGYKKIYATHVFNAACDDKTIRGWVIDTNREKFEKIEL